MLEEVVAVPVVCTDVVEGTEEVTGFETDEVVDLAEEVTLVVVVSPHPPHPPQPPRFSKAELGCSVEAALADAPVTLALASVLMAAEMDCAREAELTLVEELVATAVVGGAVLVGEGAFKTAARSNCWGAGAAAAMWAKAAAKAMLDLILVIPGD